jgi:hypothetical protein
MLDSASCFPLGRTYCARYAYLADALRLSVYSSRRYLRQPVSRLSGQLVSWIGGGHGLIEQGTLLRLYPLALNAVWMRPPSRARSQLVKLGIASVAT